MSKTTCLQSVCQLSVAVMLALLMAPPAVQAANSITVTPVQPLDFGSFVVLPSCSNCTITITSTGARSASTGIVLTSKNVGKAASFSVTCNNTTCAYTVSPVTTVSMPAGGVTMSVSTFTSVRTPTSTPSTLTVGAKLTIPGPGSTPNNYSKTFTITTSP